MNPSLHFANTNTLLFIFNSSWLLRLVGIIASAFIVTVALLYSMHLLIHKEYPMVSSDPVPVIPDFIADFPKEVQVLAEPLPVKPVEQTPPPSTRIVNPVDVDPTSGFAVIGPVVITKPPIAGVFGVGGQMVPFIKIAPQYPQVAAAKGVEGYVDIMFDVTALGTTDNIRIIAYVPSAVFNKSVIKAVKGWKYKPNVVEGTPVKTYDVKDRVRFSMEK